MNRKMVLNTVGKIAMADAAFLFMPFIVGVMYKEKDALSFAVTAVISLFIGMLLKAVSNTSNKTIYVKEGFTIVAFAWLYMSAIGALPLYFGGTTSSYIDAFFEIVSGFTTTGASILTDVESVSHGALFWRSFSNWIGGMGVLVFVMALLPNIADRSINIMRAEMPGPVVGKIVPRARDTAKILYLIYIGLTALLFLLLVLGDMPVFDGLLHSFSTAGTGGFGVKNNSIGGYTPYHQWVITVFMFIFGTNFNLYYLLLIRRFKPVFKSTELRFFICIVISSVAVICVNTYSIFGNINDTVRHVSFQTLSIVSTSGFSTVDFNEWPLLSKSILLLLMFFGGCAGSTAGGIKISRIVILIRASAREFGKMLHPHSVRTVKMEGKTLDEQTLSGVTSYLVVYVACFLLIYFVLCFESFDFETNFSAAMACFNNVGPGFSLVGPASNYSQYSGFSKAVLSFAMLLGRLEIFPLILGLNPLNWKHK